jgi:hypothetical protein
VCNISRRPLASCRQVPSPGDLRLMSAQWLLYNAKHRHGHAARIWNEAEVLRIMSSFVFYCIFSTFGREET